MFARKKISIVVINENLRLDTRFARSERDRHILALITKDLLLINAALTTDKRIASLDDQVRRHISTHCDKVPELKTICWVNPSVQEETVCDWLESGAPNDRSRTLGSFQREQ